MADGPIRLRSYRLAFELERRIHRVDRFRIPVPYGLALTTVGWWFACVMVVVLLARLPGVGPVLGMVPLPIRLGLLPAALAHLLCQRGADGRPAFERLAAYLRRAAGASCRVAFLGTRRRPSARVADVPVVSDERRGGLVPGVVRGPATVVISRPMRGLRRGRRIRLEQVEDRMLREPQRLELAARERLELRCALR